MMIRPMRPHDIAAGMRLKALAGWNQVEADWRFFLDHRPQGCFVAVQDGADAFRCAVIGTVTTTCYGRALAWISMLLVDLDYRGQGVGTRLMQAAIASLSGCSTIMLDATPAGQALYERLGFREQSRLLRLAADSLPPLDAPRIGMRPPPEGRALRPLGSGAARDRVAGLDRRVFGADRAALLQALACRAPEAAWVSRCDGRITGFCLGRDGARFQQLGPLAAETDEQAVVLCRAGLSAWSGQAVLLDVPAVQEDFIDWLRGVGFAVQRPFARMVLGEPLARSEALAQQFAICGPEYG